jgi:hypothetical protein
MLRYHLRFTASATGSQKIALASLLQQLGQH